MVRGVANSGEAIKETAAGKIWDEVRCPTSHCVLYPDQPDYAIMLQHCHYYRVCMAASPLAAWRCSTPPAIHRLTPEYSPQHYLSTARSL